MFHRSTKVIATLGILFFLASVVVCGAFYYMVAKQKMLYTELAVEQVQNQAHQESLKTLMDTLEATNEERTSLVSRILKDEDVIDLLALIEALGKEQGVTLTTNSLNIEPINEVFESVAISVEVHGSYEAIMHLVKTLEHLPYQSMLRKVQIDRKNEKESAEWAGALEVTVTKFKKI